MKYQANLSLVSLLLILSTGLLPNVVHGVHNVDVSIESDNDTTLTSKDFDVYETTKVWQCVKKLKNLLVSSETGNDSNANNIINHLYAIAHRLSDDSFEDDFADAATAAGEEEEEEDDDDDDEEEKEEEKEGEVKRSQLYNIYDKTYVYLQSINPAYAALFESYYIYNLHDLPRSTMDSENYFVINGKKYNNPDDIFYLKTHEIQAEHNHFGSSKELLEENDLVIGSNTGDDVVYATFYGCNTDEQFNEFNTNLYNEAKGGKIKYTWKSSCPWNSSEWIAYFNKETTKTKFIDVSLIKSDLENWNLNNEIVNTNYEENDTDLMDIKLAETIIQYHNSELSNKSVWDTLNYTKQIINCLPFQSVQDTVFAQNLANIDRRPKLLDDLESLMKLGINYDLIGCYVNGVNIKLTDFSMKSLLTSIQREFSFLKTFQKFIKNYSLKISLNDMKNIINDFSSASQLYIKNNQPRKFDVTKILNDNQHIITLANDLEKDKQYAEVLSTDVESFLKEESQFGEIPEYAENWNEVVFVTDFANKEMIQGLCRALEVVKNGYPQRIGILPIVTNPSKKNLKKTIKIISQLKKIGNSKPDSLLRFLNNGEGLKFNKKLTILDSDDALVKDTFELLENMGLNENSIMINGEIFPFRENTWNYLISTVIKKDATFLKNNLHIALENEEDTEKSIVRKLLHTESQPFISRDLVLTPDFQGDATYTIEDLAGLTSLKEKNLVLEFYKTTTYKIVHTLTVVDDFETKTAWENLINLLELDLFGVKIRAIHNNADGNTGNWEKLVKIISQKKLHSISAEDLIDGKPLFSKSISNENNRNSNTLDFSKWLISLSAQQVNSPRFIVINGRFVDLQSHDKYLNPIPSIDFFNFLKHEAMRSLQTIKALESVIKTDEIPSVVVEELSSLLTKMYYDDMLNTNGIDFTGESILPRLPLKRILSKRTISKSNSLFLHNQSKKRPIDLTLVIDPMEERSQVLVSHVAQLMNSNFYKFINLQFILLPTKNLKFFPMQRFYIDPKSSDLEKTSVIGNEDVVTIDVDNLELKIDYPSPNVNTVQADEFWCSAYIQSNETVVSRMNVESAISNMCIKVVNDENKEITRFHNMQIFGFGQFKLSLKDSNSKFHFEKCYSDDSYHIDGFSLDIKNDFTPWKEFSLADITSKNAYIKVSKTEKSKKVKVPEIDDNVLNVMVTIDNEYDKYDFFKLYDDVSSSSSFEKIHYWVWKHDYSGVDNLEEEFADLENIHIISYRWPKWLRPTKLALNQLNLAKFLFLDMVLPSEMKNVVYLDLKNYNDDFLQNYISNTQAFKQVMNTKGFTIGMEPYTEDEHGYWEDGYWEDYLSKNDLKFYKANNFIVNLVTFRETHVGDMLRVHYQQLSQDIFSLRNFGQDLINNIQLKTKIYSLDYTELENASDMLYDEL